MTDGPEVPGEVTNLTAAEWTKFWDTGRGPLVPHARAAVLVALSLMAIGVLMVYSASSARAGIAYQDSEFFLWRQLTWALLGLATLFFTMRVDHRNLARWAKPALIVSLVLLLAVLLPGIGHTTKGAQRWFRVGPMSLQPSELAKLTIVVWLALHLSRASNVLADWKRGIFPAAGPLALAALLVIVEPDLGTALYLAAVGAAMMLVGGVPVKRLALLSLAAVPVILWQVIRRWDLVVHRFSVFGGSSDGEMNHQVKQSLIALGAGGLFGEGLGRGTQKLFFLPEVHSDFIFPVIGEELGFLGAISVILLYVALGATGWRIMNKTTSPFAHLMAFALTLFIVFQAAFNLMVVTAMVPNKGIPLPFLSFGGSSLCFTLASIGILMNISNRSAQTAAPEPKPK